MVRLAVFWGALVAGSAASAAGTCDQAAANYGGDLLVLNVNSLTYARGGRAPVASAAACCEACGKADGCNVWSYCDAAAGCGAPGSCSSYERKNPKLSSVDVPMPVLAFGPFASCTSDGRWPKSMCSLKRVADPSKTPTTYTGAAAAGWVSGVSPKPTEPGCPAGLATATCATGLATKNPEAFFECIAKPQYYGAGTTRCAGCANLTDATARATCLGCLADFSPSTGCGSCLLWDASGGVVDEARATECFACVSAGGPETRGTKACSSCFVPSFASNTMDTAGCLACASDKDRPAAGRTGCAGCHAAGTLDRAGCLACLGSATTADRAGACGGCSSAGMEPVTARCYDCLGKVAPGAAFYCAFLGQSGGSPIPPSTLEVAAEYYACVTGAGAGGSDCTSCLNKGVNTKSCLACRPAVKSSSGLWCASCWAAAASAEAATQCQGCLASQGDSNSGYQKCISKS